MPRATGEGKNLKLLREQLARTEALLSAAGAAVWTWDFASGSVHCGNHCAALFDLPESLVPRNIESLADLVHPGDRPQFDRDVVLAAKNGADCDTEFRFLWPSGAVRFVSLRGKVFFGN